MNGNGNDVSANVNHIANINPFSYRGYYYDTETGFYLLQLYYTPTVMESRIPDWDFSRLTEATIPGIDPYYEGRFYKYK